MENDMVKKRMTEAQQRWEYFKVGFYIDELVEAYCIATIKDLHTTNKYMLREGSEGENEVPPEIADVTVAEMLESITALENIQQERKLLLEFISNVDSLVQKWQGMSKKTIDELGDSTDRRQRKAAQRLQALADQLNRVKESVDNSKNELMDPKNNMSDLAASLWTLTKTVGKLVKNTRAITSDVKIGDWDKLLKAVEEELGGVISKVPGLGTITGVAKDAVQVLNWAASGVGWIGRKIGWSEKKPENTLKDMVGMVASKPDTKFRTQPFLELFNIDDEYVQMLDEELQVKFIDWYKDFIADKAPDLKIKDLDIDAALEKWIPTQDKYKDHTVEIKPA